MTDAAGWSDDALLDALRRAMAVVETAPDDAIAAAKGSFTWRTIDAELAALTSDSLHDLEPAGTRREELSGPAGARMLTFEAPSFSVEIMVTRDRRILGFIAPAARGRVAMEQAGERTEMDTDEVGRFETDPLAAGPVRLRVVVDDTHVETAWVLI